MKPRSFQLLKTIDKTKDCCNYLHISTFFVNNSWFLDRNCAAVFSRNLNAFFLPKCEIIQLEVLMQRKKTRVPWNQTRRGTCRYFVGTCLVYPGFNSWTTSIVCKIMQIFFLMSWDLDRKFWKIIWIVNAIRYNLKMTK